MKEVQIQTKCRFIQIYLEKKLDIKFEDDYAVRQFKSKEAFRAFVENTEYNLAIAKAAKKNLGIPKKAAFITIGFDVEFED